MDVSTARSGDSGECIIHVYGGKENKNNDAIEDQTRLIRSSHGSKKNQRENKQDREGGEYTNRT